MLKFQGELKDYQKVFLFSTPPGRKGFHEQGSSALTELIKTYKLHHRQRLRVFWEAKK